MPSRLLRDGILDSDAVNSLSPRAEVFYRRLMSVVDDFGRFDARPAVLLARLFALQLDRVSCPDVSGWMAECEKVGLVATYTVDGKSYLLFHRLGKPRATESKYPTPPANLHLRADVNGCTQARADVPYSYSYSDTYSDSVKDASASCPEPEGPARGPHANDTTDDHPDSRELSPVTPAEPPVLSFPCVGTGSKEWHLTPAKLAEWQSAFPALDVPGEMRKARQWLIDNPGRRKTAKGMTRFLGSWLGRAQDRGGSRAAPARGQLDFAARAEARAVAQVAEALAECVPRGDTTDAD